MRSSSASSASAACRAASDVAPSALLGVAVLEVLLELLRDRRLAGWIELRVRQPPPDLVAPPGHQTSSTPAILLIAAANVRQVLRCSPSTFRPAAVIL
jgi:hypothetical protein